MGYCLWPASVTSLARHHQASLSRYRAMVSVRPATKSVREDPSRARLDGVAEAVAGTAANQVEVVPSRPKTLRITLSAVTLSSPG